MTCPKPILDEENVAIWNIFLFLQSQIKTGPMGGFLGFDLSALDMLLKANEVSECEWPFALEKIAILTMIASKYWNSKRDQKENKQT